MERSQIARARSLRRPARAAPRPARFRSAHAIPRWPLACRTPTARRPLLWCAPVNELCWITLQVSDVGNARRFWGEIVGLPEKSYTPGWVELELRPGLLLALHPVFYPTALEKRGYDRGGPGMGIRVMNLDQMGALVERNSARPFSAAHDIPVGHPRNY